MMSLLTRQPKSCPYCRSNETLRIGKNATLSHVRQCSTCALMFRWPKQDHRFNFNFYQSAYSKAHRSPVTDLPNGRELSEYKRNNFRGSPRDFQDYVNLVKLLGATTVLDYGCSWGYATYQFKHSGLKAYGMEVSKPRADFGRHELGVEIFDSATALIASGIKFDCIFSSHVLEHLPSPSVAFDLFDRIMAPCSTLILEVPNCGGANAKKFGVKWGPFSSALHPLSFTSAFFVNTFSSRKGALHFQSKPFDPGKAAEDLTTNPSTACPFGDELVVLHRRVGVE